MFKRISLLLAMVFVLSAIVPAAALGEAMTDVGTPRAQTLVLEPDADTNVMPGVFNPYITGIQASWGMHQIMWGEGLWDTNTMTGEAIPTIADKDAVPNEDYTEWTITIRDGLKWSDGEALDANDVVFTLNEILSNPGLTDNTYYNSLFSGVEKIDDLTLKVFCKNPFPRLMTTLGVNMWGCGFRIVPEHVYSQVEDVAKFEDRTPLAADQYVVKDYDPLGNWVLYEKRADWMNTPTGILYGEPEPQYVLYRIFGKGEARIMAAINNEIDAMNEVSYEELKMMLNASDTIRGWYSEYPYANTDDACSKGIFFNTGIEPFNNVDVRWALTLCCDWVQVSRNIFDGIGRMSALNTPAISAQVENYYKPMNDYMTNEFQLANGYKPWDPDFSLTLAASLVEDYPELEKYSDDELKDIFGTGFWKTDLEEATKLLEGTGDFELKDGKWLYKGQPWKIEVIVHPEESSGQASRSAKAIADQWMKFGVDVEITTMNGADIGPRVDLGDFQVVDNWDTCSNYMRDFYNNISGWNDETFSYEIGEKATGISHYRLPQSNPELSAKITEVIKELANVDPKSDRSYELTTEFLKLTAEAHIGIMVQAGTKIVPVNTAYWTNFPTADTPYEGPWWWWSSMRFTVTQLKAAN